MLLVLAALCAGTGSAADQSSPARPAQPAPQPDGDANRSGTAPPDDEFIEFLGADDVGDSAWWEFLKKSGPTPGDPVRTQDAKP